MNGLRGLVIELHQTKMLHEGRLVQTVNYLLDLGSVCILN
jgi:hypothetical protein